MTIERENELKNFSSCRTVVKQYILKNGFYFFVIMDDLYGQAQWIFLHLFFCHSINDNTSALNDIIHNRLKRSESCESGNCFGCISIKYSLRSWRFVWRACKFVVSLAAVFWMSRNAAWHPKNGCEGDQQVRAFRQSLALPSLIDLFTDTAAILNSLELRSIMGYPGGTYSVFTRAFREKRKLNCLFLGEKAIIITSKHGTTIFFSRKT